MTIQSSLTIVFEAPYYQGVFEVQEDYRYSVAKVNFGTSEPKLNLLQNFIVKRWFSLDFYSQQIDRQKLHRKVNPKRMQRLARKQAVNGIGNKAQEALKRQSQAGKQLKKKNRKELKAQRVAEQFRLKQIKKAQKHRGH
ncbi:YjdF family protein [Eupransor demetentiae]|uniref:DUF2992 family protein n=1 Tax=Eupransor demetentiae TaxID=3109584 RepID=A0ABM9N5F2_9LACO|nr:hypothetical protein R54876_GBNLAHCA_00980 [Lactobacillaceae bacterium LMG 33000]